MEKIDGTILISDTNKGLLTALILLLQKYFSNVVTEQSIEKVEAMAAAGSTDVVIIDAGANSSEEKIKHLELVKRISGCGQNVQVVALTNFGQSQFAMQLADAGAFDFVPKPWNNEKLLVTLRNACWMRQVLQTATGRQSSSNMEQETPLPTENLTDENPTSGNMTAENMPAATLCKEKLLGRKEFDTCGDGTGKPATLEQMEKRMMKAALKRNRGNISNAAEELGITRQTLYNKGKKYKLFE